MGSSHLKNQRANPKPESHRNGSPKRELELNHVGRSLEPIDAPTHISPGSLMPAEIDSELADLRQQLDGKNELVAALVAELEQVVEQLDRVKRNGTDRGRPAAGGSAALPAEVVEEHQQVLGEMQRIVEQWEQMQAASSLGRIESELAELRAMLARGLTSRPEDSDDNLDSVISRLSLEPTESPSMVTLSGTDWEAMKRQMLDETSEGSTGEVEDDLTKLLDSLPVPTALDLEHASIETLKRACADRDTYIVQINRWVRTRRSVTIPENWDDLDTPDEIRERAEQLTSRLEEQVRLAEVEMSLERARLSREKSQVQADRAVMEKHLKRLGIASLDELEDISVSNGSTGDRRWMRFLGVNRKS